MYTLAGAYHFISDNGFAVFVAVVLLAHVLHCSFEKTRALSALTGELRNLRTSCDALRDLLLRASSLSLRVHD